MPCDPAQRYGDGQRHIVTRLSAGGRVLGRLVPHAGEDVLGLEPHWGTCPARAGKLKAVPKPVPTLFDEVEPGPRTVQ